jgi:Maltose acetyltransferase
LAYNRKVVTLANARVLIYVMIRSVTSNLRGRTRYEETRGETMSGEERTEKTKMLAGELYDASAPELQAELAATHSWLVRYNAALDASASERRRLLLERLAAVGEGAVIRPEMFYDSGSAGGYRVAQLVAAIKAMHGMTDAVAAERSAMVAGRSRQLS